MGVPLFILLVAFAAGAVLPARWLPDLAPGRVGGLALVVVCALLGITLALVAVHVYELVRQLDQAGSLDVSAQKPDIVANAILTTLRDIGPILGLAAATFLLAPAPEESE